MPTAKRFVLIVGTICVAGILLWLVIMAQKSHSAAHAFEQLQKAEMSDYAKDKLLHLATTSPDVKSYLAIHLPQLIGDEKLLHSDNSVWINAVHLARDLRTEEAEPSLVHRIGS